MGVEVPEAQEDCLKPYGWQIFVIFVVDLVVTKFPPMRINAVSDIVYYTPVDRRWVWLRQREQRALSASKQQSLPSFT